MQGGSGAIQPTTAMNGHGNRPGDTGTGKAEKSTDQTGNHAKVGFPGKLQRARTTAPTNASAKEIRKIATAAHEEDVDPRILWEDTQSDAGSIDHAEGGNLPQVGRRVVTTDADRDAPILIVVDHVDTTTGPAVALVPEDRLAQELRGSRERRPRDWRSVPELASAVENSDRITAVTVGATRVEVAK